MKQLLRFELKKIINRKVNLIAMVLGLLLIVFSNIALICGEFLYLEEGEELEGVAAIRKQMEIENALSTELSEEFLTEFLQDYQQKIQNNPSGYDYSLIASKSNLFSLICKAYADWNNNSWGWEDLGQINTENGINFYEKRDEKIETLLNADYSYGNYTDIEKEYWMQKAEAVNTPFIWGGKGVWDLIWRSIGLLSFQMFVISICIAPVFAGEYQNRTDVLILSTKHGRTKLICAKLTASFLFVLFYIALCSIISIGINISILGIDGWNLPIQLWEPSIPYNLTAFEACGINLMIIFLLAFSITAISLLLSAVSKSQMIALAMDVLLFFGTVFLPFSKTSSLWNHTAYLFPMHIFDLREVLRIYNSYQFGNVVISYLGMIFIVYIAITVLCSYCSGRCFRK